MKNELTCAVVRDLLPSFVEGLTSEETNGAVERHLAECPACAKLRADMAAPEETPETAAPVVDYLKTVKRRTGRQVVLAILCTAALIALGIGAKVFLIGSPPNPDTMNCNASTGDGTLQLTVTSAASANAYWGLETVRREDGVVEINFREGLVSALHPSGSLSTELSLDGVREVYLCGRLFLQDGRVIHRSVLDLYEARTPYVGDAAALGRITAALQQDLPDSFTNRLQTSTEPYGWTLDFPFSCSPSGARVINAQMGRIAPAMLALVGNLGEVSWTYLDEDGVTQSRTLTLAEADRALAEKTAAYNAEFRANELSKGSVKDYADSPADLQLLWLLFRY